MKYLIVFEAPCVGTDERIITADSDVEACGEAWEISCTVQEYVMGSYDVYRLCYDQSIHQHTLVSVGDPDCE